MKESDPAPTPRGPSVTRRELIAGIATAAVVVAVPSAIGQTFAPTKPTRPARRSARLAEQTPRTMAASVAMLDGRILVTGGYDRIPSPERPLPALSTAFIVDPSTGRWSVAKPMSSGRARHAAVLLADGRVTVVGGFGTAAIASVEIYDPTTDSWTVGPTLEQPRYDHAATVRGNEIVVIGDSNASIVLGVEVLSVSSQGSSERV